MRQWWRAEVDAHGLIGTAMWIEMPGEIQWWNRRRIFAWRLRRVFKKAGLS